MLAADYVIVGAGTAGCVLASRLTENPNVRVVVLEAGGKDRSPNIKIPAAFPEQFHTKLDWDYYTEPEPHCDGRRLYIPRGRSLGGSSSMNAMLYVRGRPLDYDLWEQKGAEGWGWDDVRPYFLKAENDERGASEHHGSGGPVNVQNQRSPRHLNFEKHGEEEYDGHCFVTGPTLLTPKARGEVTLASSDPAAKPRIITNALSEPEDVASMLAGMKLAREIVGQEPLRSKTIKAIKPTDGVRSDEDLVEHLRSRVELIYHPVGTCRAGTDDLAVVDPELRIRGLDGLRVVDASIMPVIPGGNTNAPTIMVAERAADLIKGRVGAKAAA